MGMAKLHFELLTPEETLISGEMDMVIVPGTEGDMGVLPGHVPLVSALREGMVVAKNGEENLCFFVKNGFVEISRTHTAVLTDRVANLAETLPAALDMQLEATKDEEEKSWLTALQKVIRNPSYPIK